MGCDGGTIPKRKEVVKKKTREPREQRDSSLTEAEKWSNCALGDWFLRKPIMAGHYGHLFSKEGVLEILLERRRDTIPYYHALVDKAPLLDTLHSMKDVKELKLMDNPIPEETSSSQDESIRAPFVCPITGLETNGKYKFFFSWNCGCVVSERAIKEVGNEKKCLVCQEPYEDWDLVQINPKTGKEFNENQAKFAARKFKVVIEEHEKKHGPIDGNRPFSSRRARPNTSKTPALKPSTSASTSDATSASTSTSSSNWTSDSASTSTSAPSSTLTSSAASAREPRPSTSGQSTSRKSQHPETSDDDDPWNDQVSSTTSHRNPPKRRKE